MKFTVSTKKEDLSSFPDSGASFINKSGIYDITIKFASVAVTAEGAESVNFNIEYNGGSQTLYGPYVTNKDGATNDIGARVINGLAVIAGMDEGAGFSIEKEEHGVGRDNKVQEFDVITDFTDLTCKVRVQEEYSINPKTSEIKDRLVIKEFYRADGASAAEVASGNDIGKQNCIKQVDKGQVSYPIDFLFSVFIQGTSNTIEAFHQFVCQCFFHCLFSF